MASSTYPRELLQKRLEALQKRYEDLDNDAQLKEHREYTTYCLRWYSRVESKIEAMKEQGKHLTQKERYETEQQDLRIKLKYWQDADQQLQQMEAPLVELNTAIAHIESRLARYPVQE